MADSPMSIDGLTTSSEEAPVPSSTPKPTKEPLSKAVRTWEHLLIGVASAIYIAYIFWAFILISILPSSSVSLKPVLYMGLGSAALAGLFFVGSGIILLMHIAQSHVPVEIRKKSLIRLVVFIIPGLLISLLMPYLISREPAISVDIVSPASSQEWIAPVAMTFSVEKAVQTLAGSNFRPISYKWDINGDRKTDQETLVPTLIATYDTQGIFTLSVTMTSANGTTRTASKRFVILTSVFGVSPSIPIVEKPVIFSVAGLLKDPKTLTQVDWDFDGDGKIDETGTVPQMSYTYFKTGKYIVTATITLQNKTQASYQRTISVENPAPLPFPVEIQNEPTNLIGSTPFASLFSIVTKEPIVDVQWDFGDGEKGTGIRAAHTYTQNGDYAVQAKVRSESGVIATLHTSVQVVERLQLNDLTFEGSPLPQGETITGEAPLTLNLTPHTNTAFVTFKWEAPEATEVGATDTSVQAIYRRDGTYTLTLIAQDLNNHVLRKSFKVVVNPPSALVSVKANPETGLAPLTVNFDASETSIPNDDPTGFIWNFGDGTPEITQGANVTHTYTIPKTYTIGLTVQTVSGKSYRATAALVVRAPILAACMTRSKDTVQAGSSVQFYSDCTTGTAQSYLWDFGDNAQASEQNPVHLFTDPGTYTVSLTVNDGKGFTNTTTSSLTVQP